MSTNQLPSIYELECFLGRKIILENGSITHSDLQEYQALQEERKQELLTVLDKNIQTKAPILDLNNAPLGSKSFYLWLTGKEIELQKLSEFDWLEAIKLGGYYKTFSGKENLFSPLVQIPTLPKQLKVLEINGGQIKNTQNLINAQSLQKLKLYICEIEDLSDVGKLQNLRYLDLSYNRSFLKDLSPLKKLTKLRILYINFCDIQNIEALANLTELEELYATYCGISDITPLKKLQKLHTLNLSRNAITNIDTLEHLDLLKNLDLSDNQISNIDILAKLNIKDLAIKENPVGMSINQVLGKNSKRFPTKKEIELYLKSL